MSAEGSPGASGQSGYEEDNSRGGDAMHEDAKDSPQPGQEAEEDQATGARSGSADISAGGSGGGDAAKEERARGRDAGKAAAAADKQPNGDAAAVPAAKAAYRKRSRSRSRSRDRPADRRDRSPAHKRRSRSRERKVAAPPSAVDGGRDRRDRTERKDSSRDRRGASRERSRARRGSRERRGGPGDRSRSRSRDRRRSRSRSRDRRDRRDRDRSRSRDRRRERSRSRDRRRREDVDSARGSRPPPRDGGPPGPLGRPPKELTMFVAGLGPTTHERDLEDMFGPYGRIIEIRLNRDRLNGRCKGFAFLAMSREEEVDEAIRMLDRTTINGYRLTVERAKTDRR